MPQPDFLPQRISGRSLARAAQAVAVMDSGIRFMTVQTYRSSNPAMAAVRAPMVVGFWVMMLLAATILIWGALVPIDSAAVAKGTVVLLSNKKTVQHLEGGIIQAILVKEGDTVTAGQPLIRLSNANADANNNLLLEQLYAARATQSRLVAERDNQQAVAFDADMVQSAKTNDDIAKAVAAQAHLFESEEGGQKAKLAVLDQRIAQSEEEISGLKSQLTSTDGQMKLYAEETNTVQVLLKKGYDTKPHLLDLQRHLDELQGNKGRYEADIAKAQQNIIETHMQTINQQKEFETKVAQDLRDAQAQIADLGNKLRSAKDVVDRTLITAPVGGIVTGLKYHTTGGVIAPGTPIMDIVPQDDLLVIEAKVKPSDISVVRNGLDARVIFTSYKTRSTPKIPGKVTQVSADTFSDDRSMQASPYYTVRIEVDKHFLQSLKKPIELYPGMPAEVMIRTGSRSFLSYLFRPIADSMHSAFREE